MENILAPSILSADFKILGEQIEQTEKAGAKYIHFDVMDGIFVPSISFGMPVLSALKGAVKQALDVLAISQGQDTVAKHHGMQAPEGQPMEMAGM